MAWWILIKERFPLPVYFLMIAGVVLSAACLGPYVDLPSHKWIHYLAAFDGLLIFFFVLRFMDEVKDYDKDIVAHPERPLPRGLLSVEKLKKLINVLAFVMVLRSFVLIPFFNNASAFLYLFLTLYLWLMYKEFFISKQITKYPLVYAVSHQIVLFVMCAYAVSFFDNAAFSNPRTWLFGLMIFGSFFTYEVCRKLDPKAHKLLQTYRNIYGDNGVRLLVMALSISGLIGAYKLGLLSWSLPLILLLNLTLVLFLKNKYKIIEVVASINLMYHMWLLVITRSVV